MTIERGPDERVSNNSASNPATSSYRNYRFPNVVIPPSSIQAQRRHLTSNREQQQPRREHEILMPVKPVYKLTCGHCSSVVCARGMKAILLADTAVELYSTDVPSQRYNSNTHPSRYRNINYIQKYSSTRERLSH